MPVSGNKVLSEHTKTMKLNSVNDHFLSAGITVLLSLTVFMLLVAEIMPATSDSVPLIGELPPLLYFSSLIPPSQYLSGGLMGN